MGDVPAYNQRLLDDTQCIIGDEPKPCFHCRRVTRRIDIGFEGFIHKLCSEWVWAMEVSRPHGRPRLFHVLFHCEKPLRDWPWAWQTWLAIKRGVSD